MDTVSYLLGKKAGGGSGSNLQTKSVEITQNGSSTISPDEGYDGLSAVNLTTNVPQPSGTINITQNGTVDVSSYASADVNVPADVSTYFDIPLVRETNYIRGASLIKKLPENFAIDFTNSADKGLDSFFSNNHLESLPASVNLSGATNLSWFLAYSYKLVEIDISGWNLGSGANLTNFFYNSPLLKKVILPNYNSYGRITSMFEGCTSLEEVDMSGFTQWYYPVYLFKNCTSLQKIDISGFSSTPTGTTTEMFTNVPTNCLILVKNQTVKNWFTTNWSNLTNVQIKSEYIANQGA